eukprot:g7328.t1
MDELQQRPDAVEAGREARILTWNINGLKKVAASHGGIKELLDNFNSDIVCFQEIKITRAGLVEHDLAQARGYHGFFNHCKLPRRVSYSGVATFIRAGSGLKTPASTTSLGDSSFFGSPGSFAGELGLSPDRLAALDSEGRVVITDHGHFVLFNVYAPCISSGDEDDKTEERRAFKMDFLATLEARILELRERGRGVVLVGDLNACASQLDHGFALTDAEFYSSRWSKWIRRMLGLGSPDPPRLVDCFRRLHPGRKDAFTCWNTQTGARENNYGTRIDYIIADAAFAGRGLRECDIMPDFLGSDHCPVRARFVVPLSPGSTSAGGAPAEGGRGRGIGCGGEDGWLEHPPGCSCFYQELTAKQEKLAKYFVAAAKKQTPGGDAEEQRGARGVVGGLLGESDAGSHRRRGATLPAAVGGESGAGLSMRTLSGATLTGRSNGGGGGANWMVREQKAGGVRRTLSSSGSGSSARGATIRRADSGRPRQSKLRFGAAASTTIAGAGAGRGGGSGGKSVEGAPAERASSRIDDVRGHAPSEVTAAAAAAQEPRTSTGAKYHSHPPSAGSTQGRGDDVPAGATTTEVDRSIDSNSNSISNNSRRGESDEGGAEARSCGGSSGGSGGSAEAWKALFGGQKKSAPPCEHGEPSIQRTVLKPGPNYNRRFYTCARSAGSWPTDRNARCNFFQWRRDGVRGYKDRPSRGESTSTTKRRRT